MKLVRQLWYILTPRERAEAAFLLCAMALGACFETLSVGVIFPFIAVLKQPELLASSHHLQPLLSHLSLTEPRKLLPALGLALISLFALKTVYLIGFYRWLYRYAMKKHVNLSRQLLGGYLRAPYTLHVQRNSADLIRVTTRSVEDFASIFMVNLLIVLGEVLVLAALTGLLMVVEPLGTVGAVIALGVPTVVINRSTQPRLTAAGRVAEESFAAMIQWAGQAISGVKEITITGRRSFFLDQHAFHVQRFSNSNQLLSFLVTFPRFLIDTLSVIALVAIATILLARGQDLQSSLLLLGMFALAAVRMVPSTTRLSSALAQVRFRYASTEVIYRELLALRQRPSDPRLDPGEDKVSPAPFREALALENVSYFYPAARGPAIDDLSIVIPRGHWVGFIGPTGAGKTTLADLILGLLTPTSGRILLDGHNLHDNLAGWQRNIGYVPQTTYLIDDSVRRNVAYGVPEAEINDERVWRALRTAQVDHLVRSLPGELDAMVGERGGRLSGGERQRLGIARALYGDPEVLVIDEGTSNLDPVTEAAIVEVVAGLRGKKTIIVIAHRPAFIRNCDCIFMLAQGRLRSQGRYSELLAKNRDFSEFCGTESTPVPVPALPSD